MQQGALGPLPRAIPSWLTVPGYYSLAGARRWHFFFGWLFALNGLLYVIYNVAVGHMRKLFFTLKDAAKVPAMIAYYLRLRKESPQEGEYNPLQKMAYTSVFVMLTPLVLLSGMAMSPQLNVAFNWLPAMFGGRQLGAEHDATFSVESSRAESDKLSLATSGIASATLTIKGRASH